MVCSVCSARRRVLLVRRSLQKQENKNGIHRLTTGASRFLFYPVFPRIRNNSWQVLPLRPQCFWAILLSQYRRRTGIFPLLFVPAAAGVMELWAEMGNMLLPIIIAIVPVTVLVLASAGRTTQALTSRRKNKEAAHD